jgi:hypothetical protein
MARLQGRRVFWVGFLMYAESFFLSAVGGRGVFTPKPPSGFDAAIDCLLFPWTYLHWNGMNAFWTNGAVRNVSIAISGWVNPIFLLTMLSQLVGRTFQLTKVLRCVVLLMQPFCWIVFLTSRVYPREGYFLWVTGMLLVLFSNELEKRQFASATSLSGNGV